MSKPTEQELRDQCEYLLNKAQECGYATAPAYEQVAHALLARLNRRAVPEEFNSSEEELAYFVRRIEIICDVTGRDPNEYLAEQDALTSARVDVERRIEALEEFAKVANQRLNELTDQVDDNITRTRNKQ